MKTEVYLLLGPAAIGKTTYIKQVGFPKDKLAIISRDDIVADVSKKYNLSFDDLYRFPPPDAEIGTYIPGFENCGRVIESLFVVKHLQPRSYEYLNSVNAEINYRFYNEFQAAIRNKDINFIVVDRVHLRSYERNIYFDYLSIDRSSFVVTAVLFNFQDKDTLDLISEASALRTKQLEEAGERVRTVSREVQEKMIKHYEPIKESDGFDSVIHIDTLPMIRKFLNKV